MEIVRFLYDNYWDRRYGPITFNSETTDYEASKTQHYWLKKTYRSTGIANEWLKKRLTVAPKLGVNAFVIDNHNFTNAATLRIQGNNVDGWGAPVVNVLLSIIPGSTKVVCFWKQTQYYDYWRVTIADAGNPEAYLQAGRIFLGLYTMLSRSFNTVHPITYSDPSIKMLSGSRQVSGVSKEQYRAWAYEFMSINAVDAQIFQTIWGKVGRFKPYYICEDPDERHTTTHYVHNINSWPIQHVLINEQFDLNIAVREAK